MAHEHLKAHARRVVVGLDKDGKSTFVSDGLTPTRLATEAYTLNQIWQAVSVPTPVTAENMRTVPGTLRLRRHRRVAGDALLEVRGARSVADRLADRRVDHHPGRRRR